ncbi:dihydroorotate dehydrogenase [Lentimicrobium saccharophilum]|uniref:Dihydroorotate dehydrogenase n=1 Tax=Lentimicrobium saccharophilum TaxID=1678841 RepID=A0A0S7BX93_9BACT|nr:dihydroorotate dehydrogenase-like protein [Lentimicrobium saccharophilum]GAP43047.1 dihydroorotate dehydrogenase [Lentimicrobium saccharophilum]
MANIETKYMGLTLSSPVIIGSSGLTSSLANIREFAGRGAGAVVLKSLFEEQIMHEIAHTSSHDTTSNIYPEALDYISNYSRNHRLEEYLTLIRDAKHAVQIPIIASINCISSDEWTTFARKIEDAGADALELNIFVMPSDPTHGAEQNEKLYFTILDEVKKQVRIPVALKISYYFSGLAKMALKLSWAGAKGIVLFNRFYSPDINIDTMKVVATNVFSSPEEISTSLRWVAMLSDRLYCDVCASTGIHDSEGMIKQLLAGAKAVQIASTLYKNGFGRIDEMNAGLKAWMEKHGFEKTEDFIGKMSFKKVENPGAYERVQFMKHFAGIE